MPSTATITRSSTRPPMVVSAATMSEVPSRAAEVTAPWTALPRGIVDGGEIVVLALKPSMWRPIFEAAPWLVTTCLLAAALTGMHTPIPGFSLAMTAQFVLLIGLARLGFAVVRWVPTWYVLTSRRILTIHGVRAPRISSCPLIEIRNTYLHTVGVECLAGLGTLTFVTEHPEESPRLWRSIPKPDEVHAKVRRAIQSAIDHSSLSL